MAKSGASKATSTIKNEPTPSPEPEFEGADPDSLIFPEWSDQELNSEKWENPKSPTKEKKEPRKKSPTVDADPDSPKGQKIIILPPPPLPFRDPHSFTLPSSLRVYKWKKPEVLFPGRPLVVYKDDPSKSYSNFTEGNIGVCESSFMRGFIACIGTLEYLGNTCPWPMEGANVNYTPNTEDQPWRGWHHVYSSCKAGKGQKHHPQANKLGKYIVRLFWMGAWRRIVVDDFLPVDRKDDILLPSLPSAFLPTKESSNMQNIRSSTSQRKEGKPIKKEKSKSPPKAKADSNDNAVELWPYLLCKALLKIANLTWTYKREAYDNSILRCLTGWVCQKINTHVMDPNQIWEICSTYTKHYEYAGEEDTQSNKNKKGNASKNKKTEHAKSDKSDKEKKTKEKTKGTESIVSPFCVMAKLADTRLISTSTGELINHLPKCWGHMFLITTISDIPLRRQAYTEPLAKWKLFRWIDWAAAHGIYYTNDTQSRFLQFVDFFKDINNSIDASLNTVTSAQNVNNSNVQPWDVYQPGTPYYSGADTGIASGVKKISSIKTSLGEVKEDAKKAGSKMSENFQEDNLNMWIDFNQIGRYIENLYIFFKPKLLHSHVCITDLEEKLTSTKTTKDAKPQKSDRVEDRIEKKIIWPYNLLPFHNQPLYLFFDTLESKILVVALSHSGNRQILEQKCLVVHCDLTSLWQKKIDFNQRREMRTCCHVVLEKYNWQTETFGEHVLCIWTTGTKSLTMSLDAGRQVFRLWIGSPSSYYITILSDVDVHIGTMEFIFEKMQCESERLLQFCLDFGADFGELIKSFGSDQFLDNFKKFILNSIPSETFDVDKKKLGIFQNNLLNALINAVKEKIPNCAEACLALKILLLRPDISSISCPPIQLKVPKKKVTKPVVIEIQAAPEWSDNECLSETTSSGTPSIDEVLIEKQREKAACTIQAFFKMIYVKKLMEYHNENHPCFKNIVEELRKVYQIFFNVDTRIENFPVLFRRVIDPDILMNYSWGADLQLVINNQVLVGSIPGRSVTALTDDENQWVFLGKYVFFVDSPHEETVKATLLVNLDQYVIRIVNNDTLDETIRGVNSVLVSTYTCNAYGYTVFAYGWVGDQRAINYQINLITLKRTERYPLIIQDNQQDMPFLADIYHNNKSGLITKAIVGISNDVSLSLMFKCSYEEVGLKLTCRSPEGKVIQEITGKGSVVLPVLRLEYKEEQEKPLPSKTSSKSERFKSKRSLTSLSSRRKSSQRSSQRQSSAGSVVSLAKTPKSSKTDKPTCFYTLEVKVLNKSWPLTKEEWRQSDKQAQKNLIGGLLSSLSGKTSSRSLLKKLSEINKKKLANYDHLPDPKWQLQMFYNADKPVELKLDQTRCNEIRMNKFRWYEGDTARFDQAKKLRNAYLNELEKEFNSFGFDIAELEENESYAKYETKELSTVVESEDHSTQASRTLVHPDLLTKSSKKSLDYDKYGLTITDTLSLLTDRQEDGTYSSSASLSKSSDKKNIAGWKCFQAIQDLSNGTIKKIEDFENDVIKIENALEQFEEYRQNYLLAMTEYRQNCLWRTSNVNQWFEEIRAESAELIKLAYQKKEMFLEMSQENDDSAGNSPKSTRSKKKLDTVDDSTNKKESKKDKKDKKDKKKSKSSKA